MARVAEYLVSIFEDAIREGNYDIKDITKKALAKRKELKLSGFAGGEEVILRNFKTYLADKNSMSVEAYTKYIKDRINNPELPQTPNWNRPLAGTPFEAKGIGATKNTPVGNLNKALASLTDEEKKAWRSYTDKQQKKAKYERKFKTSERFDPETGKFVYDSNIKKDALAKKYIRKNKRRALKAGAYDELTPKEKLKFEFFEKRISTMGDLIKKNPNYMLGNDEVVKALSTAVDPKTGKIISKKPTFTDLKKRRAFEVEHIDPVIGGQTKGRGAFLRNLQVLPEPIHNNFKNNAETFLNKNFGNPKYESEIKNILDKANELKVQLRVNNVGSVGYKPKFENFLDKADDVFNFYVRDAKAKKLYSQEIDNLKPANVKYNWKQLGFDKPPSIEVVNDIIAETTRPAFVGSEVAKEGVLIDNFVKKVQSIPGGCQAVVRRALGGPIDTCEAIIRSNPKAAALKLNNAITATKGPLKDLKQESQKLANLIDTGQITTADNLRPDNAKLADTFNETNLRWNNDIGAIVETNNPDFAVKNVTEDLKLYAEENPIPVDIDTKPPKTSPTVLKTVGKTLAKVGSPLPTALIDSYFVGQQVKDGKSSAEIAQDPMNWIGLAAMEPLSKAGGIAQSGKLNTALRLGLNPATIRGISRFAGLPGLAVSTAMTAYDQYKKYQNEEGFIYNLFNKEEK